MKLQIDNLLPKWVSKKWREGSMGAAEKKNQLIACAVFTAISIILSIVLYFGGGIPTDNFRAASGFLKFLSVVGAVVSPYSIWKAPDFLAGEKNGFMYGVFLLAPTLLSWVCAYIEDAGFQ
jgi:hypothetical protein